MWGAAGRCCLLLGRRVAAKKDMWDTAREEKLVAGALLGS